MTNKKFLLTAVKMIVFLGIVGIFILPLEGHAESVFSKALDTLYTTFANARKVVYIAAGFGLVGVAVAAISGKLPWKWLAMISVALFTLAVAEKIVMNITDVGSSSNVSSNFEVEIKDSEFKGINNGNADSSRFDNITNSSGEDSSFRSFLESGS